jgi:V-type H+-transporting ATPase subunit E
MYVYLLTNKSRLRLLHHKAEQIQGLFSTSHLQIMTFAEDEGRYSQFLEGAIVQEFLRLMEPNVTLTAREKDVERVHKAAETGS